MPENENCLAGLQCPECGALQPFDITVRHDMRVFDHGTGPDNPIDNDIQWDDDSRCRCIGCGYTDTVADFRVPPPVNVFSLAGKWEESVPGEPGHLYFTPHNRQFVVIFGTMCHVQAIQTKGESEQVAAYPQDQEQLEQLQAGAGTSEGLEEIDIHGKPYVFFIVPFDR
jgi:hypothetical protein